MSNYGNLRYMAPGYVVKRPCTSDEPDALQEFQKTILEEIRSLKAGFEEKLTELQQEIQELKAQNAQKPELPIRDSIIGEWEMISYENFREYSQRKGLPFEDFAENLKFKLDDRRLVQLKGESVLKEGVVNDEMFELFVENNRLKTVWKSGAAINRFIEDGKLHYVHRENSCFFKRVYRRV